MSATPPSLHVSSRMALVIPRISRNLAIFKFRAQRGTPGGCILRDSVNQFDILMVAFREVLQNSPPLNNRYLLFGCKGHVKTASSAASASERWRGSVVQNYEPGLVANSRIPLFLESRGSIAHSNALALKSHHWAQDSVFQGNKPRA